MDQEKDRLLEPIDAYRNYYFPKFRENEEKLFDSLLQKSGIDVQKNRTASANYRESVNLTSRLRMKLGTWKVLRGLLIALAVILFLVSLYFFSRDNLVGGILSLLFSVVSVFLILWKLNGITEKYNADLEKQEDVSKEHLCEAEKSIAPLTALFTDEMTTDLIQQTVPAFVIDPQFDMKRYDYLAGKYHLQKYVNPESSVVDVMSGDIYGNPFLYEKKLFHQMGTECYTGSLTISWTTTYRDSNGNTRTQVHTQVLTASVTKPKPFYHYETHLIYGNDSAPDLQFTHTQTHAENMSNERLNRFVKSKTKEIRKQAKREGNTGFTEMGNDEFDALFGATDRNNEVQFRLLFTPLAQKNMLSLIKGGSPFGDDFFFRKDRCLNYIFSEHMQNRSLHTGTGDYRSYDVDACKDKFLNCNEAFFKAFYFDFAPLLSIPLYQQIKPTEYLYRTDYERNFTEWEAEVLANRFPASRYALPTGVTPAILKTSFCAKDGKKDRLIVSAFSYYTVGHIDYIPVLGGDGRIHDVPVPWDEYIPVSTTAELVLRPDDDSDAENKAQQDTNCRRFHRIFASVSQPDNCRA